MDINSLSNAGGLDEGTWIDDIPELDGVRLKVRSTKYRPFQVATAALVRRSGKRMRTGEGIVSYQVAAGKPLAEHILLDWDMSKATGPTAMTSHGDPLVYTRENAEMLLTADDDFGIGAAYRAGVEYAGDLVADRIAERAKEAAGN